MVGKTNRMFYKASWQRNYSKAKYKYLKLHLNSMPLKFWHPSPALRRTAFPFTPAQPQGKSEDTTLGANTHPLKEKGSPIELSKLKSNSKRNNSGAQTIQLWTERSHMLT